jgi:hypothetical protein
MYVKMSSLAAGVTGVDHKLYVLAGQQLLQLVKTVLRGLDRLQLELLRDDRQRVQPPEAVLLLVDVLGHLQLDDVAHGGGDDVVVIFKVVPLLGDLAERARQIHRNRWFLRDDE